MRLLHSIEENQFADLPAKPFIRGFVTSYSRFIGLDPQEVLIRFNDYIDSKSHDRPSRESGHSGYAFEKREGEQSRTILWVVMGGFVVVGAVGAIFLKPSLKHHRSSHLDKLKAPSVAASPGAPAAATDELPAGATLASPSPGPSSAASPEPAAVAAASPSPAPAPSATTTAAVAATVPATPSPTPTTPAASPSPSASRKPDPLNNGTDLARDEIRHKVVVKALGDVWVRYQVDQKPKMRIILRKDRVLVLRAQERSLFQVSHPDQISFSYNNGAYRGIAGYKGAVRKNRDLTLHFPSEVAETATNPFESDSSIAGAEVPPSRASTDLSNSTP